MYVCMYMCVCLCMYVGRWVGMYVCAHVCMFVCVYVCMCVCVYGCASVCMFVCLFVCLFVRMFVCLLAIVITIHKSIQALYPLLPPAACTDTLMVTSSCATSSPPIDSLPKYPCLCHKMYGVQPARSHCRQRPVLWACPLIISDQQIQFAALRLPPVPGNKREKASGCDKLLPRPEPW